jgi:hypothetical protein
MKDVAFKMCHSVEKDVKLHPIFIRLSLNDSSRFGSPINYRSINAKNSIEMVDKLQRKVKNLPKLKRPQE